MRKFVTLFVIVLTFLDLYAPPSKPSQPEFHNEYTIDNKVVDIMEAIKHVESRGNYNAIGGSGEYGAYQITPLTWKYWCKQIIDTTYIDMTDINQDIIVFIKVKRFVCQGYSVKQIASIWNCGSSDWRGKIGVNKYGVKYNTPLYVNKVYKQYLKLYHETFNNNISNCNLIMRCNIQTR